MSEPNNILTDKDIEVAAFFGEPSVCADCMADPTLVDKLKDAFDAGFQAGAVCVESAIEQASADIVIAFQEPVESHPRHGNRLSARVVLHEQGLLVEDAYDYKFGESFDSEELSDEAFQLLFDAALVVKHNTMKTKLEQWRDQKQTK